jgi:hypothetical protein
MKKLHMTLLVVGLITFMASIVFAANGYSDIQGKIEGQQRRIEQGVKKGTLTPSEAQKLQGNLNYIQNEEMRLRNDGMLTRQEVKRLNEMLNQNNKMIYNKKHNPNAVRQLY